MSMHVVLLYRFQSVAPETLDLLVPPLREAFGLPVRIAKRPVHLGDGGRYADRDQWLARELVKAVAAAPAPDPPGQAPSSAVRLGLAGQDLFTPGLNFVFGEASSEDRCAVMSIARLDDAFYGLPPSSPDTVGARCATEAVHELGHVFGLPHCRHRNCVMWFSNTLQETDAKGWRFCRECHQRLAAALRREEL